MHEVSLAEALLAAVVRHVPPGGVVCVVRVRAGPMRGVEPESMQWAWRAVTLGTACEQAALQLELLPWTLRCPDCGRQFESAELFATCSCGCDAPSPIGGDELLLLSLEVTQPDPGADGAGETNASASC